MSAHDGKAMTPAERFRPKTGRVTFEFENQEAAERFLNWMSNSGEQEYWEAMRYQERNTPGPITGVDFNYHEPGEGTVTVTCGRVSDE